jgi:hypothetical protein
VHRISNPAAGFNEFSGIRHPAEFGENPVGFKLLFSWDKPSIWQL